MCDLFREKTENLWRTDEHIPIIRGTMVGVAQLVELRIVIPAVGGSNPLVHPISLQELYTAAFYSMNTLGVFLHMLRQG